MTTTEAPTPPKVQERLPKPLRELQRKLKQGFRFEQTSGSNHYRIRDSRRDRLVEYRGRPFQISSSPSPGVIRAAEDELREAQALKGTAPRKPTPEAEKRKREANQARVVERQKTRQRQATALRKRFVDVFAHGGGIVPGLSGDLGHVGALILREMPKNGSKRLRTPDLLVQNAHRMLNGAWVEPDYAVVWETLADRLEAAPDPIGEWYTLVREARGLPADRVSLRLPEGTEDEWPFRVELLPLDSLLVDETYQRPVAWAFVRKEAARFDPSLVGTIDVAQRSPSHFAILDGQQRSQIVRLVGKSTIYASIYVGLDVASEARFFLHKNRDRKIVHPYYTFRAELTSLDEDAQAMQAIVEKHGYTLSVAAPNDTRPNNIAAIAAVRTAYTRKLSDGSDTLDPTLGILRKSTLGREHGQDSLLIRGVSGMIVDRPDVVFSVLSGVISELGPTLILGRARDLKRAGTNGEQAVGRVLSLEYERAMRSRRRSAES